MSTKPTADALAGEPATHGEFERAWRALEAGAAHGEWFAGPDWVLPWLAAYARGRHDCSFLLRDETALVGVVPLITGRAGASAVDGTCGTPVNAEVRRIGVLAAGDPAAVYARLFEERLRTDRDAIAIRQVPVGSAEEQALLHAIRTLGLHTIRREDSLGAVIDLRDGLDAYLSSRSREVRRGRTRKWKRLEQLGGWQLRIVRDEAELTSAWDAVLSVEAASWKHAPGSSFVSDPAMGAFYADVSRRAAQRGRLRLVLLEHDGTCVAHALCVADKGVLYALKTSYSEAQRDLSPGSVVMWRAIELATEERCTRLDLLGELMAWKSQLITEAPAHASYVVFRAGNVRLRIASYVEHTLKPVGRRIGLDRAVRRVTGRAGA